MLTEISEFGFDQFPLSRDSTYFIKEFEALSAEFGYAFYEDENYIALLSITATGYCGILKGEELHIGVYIWQYNDVYYSGEFNQNEGCVLHSYDSLESAISDLFNLLKKNPKLWGWN